MKSAPLPSPRYALVTGAASGLGRALALRLAQSGYHVVVADVDETAGKETIELIQTAGGVARFERLDVRDFHAWQELVSRLRSDWPRLDLLVNNAGVACSGRVGVTPLEDWRWLLDINLFGVLHGCYACLGWLKQNPGMASIINISSIAAVLSPPAMATYNVAKAGVLSLTETMASELYGSNVRMTVACPGFFRSRLLDCGRFQSHLERANAERYTNTAPMNAEQIAERILAAAERGKLHVFLPARARWIWYFRRYLPRLWFRLLGSGYTRQCSNLRQ